MDTLLDALRAGLSGPLHILVKGSRRMRMERVIDALRTELADNTTSHGGEG
jgi:UDP-N-acetylmuramyl pentapeptide synthase